MLWQHTIVILLWCMAVAYAVRHIVLTYTNANASCQGCSTKPTTQQQTNKPVQLGASLQKGLRLLRQKHHP